ncbi:ABC transporter substrate-binding protein [Candidatus Bipolaricaulota bacterium]|nr:ABC transporter substrate-binding protein [Candidatus Bipolaricaulota bacterium]
MREKTGLTISLVLVVALIFGAFFAGPAHGAEYVKLGSIQPLTGSLAAMGVSEQNAIDMAVKDINNAGGPLGKEVMLVRQDSQTKPAAGASAAHKLISVSGVPAIIGATSSGVTIAISEVTIPNQTVQISTGSTSPRITYLDDNDFVSRTAPPDIYCGGAMAMWAREQGSEKASTFVVENPYGLGLSHAFADAFEAAGGEILNQVGILKNKSSYRSELRTAFEGDPDVVMNAAYAKDDIVAMKQWYELDLPKVWFEAPEGRTVGMIDELGEIYNGIPVIDMHTPTTSFREKFSQNYEDTYDRRVGVWTRHAYDATMAIALTIQKIGPEYLDASRVEKAKLIRDHLRDVTNPPGEKVTYPDAFAKGKELLNEGKEINYEGVSGAVDFTETGDVVNDFMIWRVKNQEFVEEKKIKSEDILDFLEKHGIMKEYEERWGGQ